MARYFIVNCDNCEDSGLQGSGSVSSGEWVKPSDECGLVLCRIEGRAEGEITT